MEYKILDVSANPITGNYTISAQALDAKGTNFTAFVSKKAMTTYPSAGANKAILDALNERYVEVTGVPVSKPMPNLRPLINSVVGGDGKKKTK
jgi:hypothetical protein